MILPISNQILISKLAYICAIVKSSSLSKRIQSIARTIFNTFLEVIQIPFRYLGSKTWSIPGIILRTPGILIRRIILGDHSTPLKEEFFGAGYHYTFEKGLTPEETRSYHSAVCMTAFVFQNKVHWLNRKEINYELIKPESLHLNLAEISPEIECHEHCFFDKESGLKVVLVKKDNKILLCFGAHGCYETEVEPSSLKEKIWNRVKYNNIPFWQNILGGRPLVYQRAAEMVRLIKNHSSIKDKDFSVCGLSFGGALAAYAGLQNQVPTICFNSMPLGVGLQSALGEEKLKKADHYVTHITSCGDYASDPLPGIGIIDRIINLFGMRTLGNFGKRYWIPPLYSRFNFNYSHGRILDCIEAYIKKGGLAFHSNE